MSLLERLRREDGELGMLSALLLLAGVLLPIMFIVVAFARIENGRLAAAGGAGAAMHANASVDGNEVTIRINGQAPHLFNVPLVLPAVAASASLPLEQYPANEQVAVP